MTEPSKQFTDSLASFGFARDTKKQNVIFVKYEGDRVYTIDYKNLYLVRFGNIRTDLDLRRSFTVEKELVNYLNDLSVKDVMRS